MYNIHAYSLVWYHDKHRKEKILETLGNVAAILQTALNKPTWEDLPSQIFWGGNQFRSPDKLEFLSTSE